MAGLRESPESDRFVGMLEALKAAARLPERPQRENTVIGVVATNAKMTKEEINKVAQMANAGIAQAVRPAHTMYDGDTMFAVSTGEIPANVTVIGAFAAEAVAQAIRNGVRAATTLHDVRAING
jgi:L-aminopeptidase/D-esterase-like protein